MKKINSKGFTLIELLAVITIMGILMMVAIPSISRTIENSRRDTFADVGKSYINTVRNAVLADEFTCSNGTQEWSVAATPDGAYYFRIDSNPTGSNPAQSNDLMESGGKSSWGGADVKGYVVWNKTTEPAETSAGADVTKTKYAINLYDTGKHGTTGEVEEEKVVRSKISAKLNYSYSSGSGAKTAPEAGYGIVPSGITPVECELK